MEIKYKDSTNKVHQIPEGYEHLMVGWPVGYVKIDDAEADAILAPPPQTTQQKKDTLLTQINALETKEKMNRFVREWALLEAVTKATTLGYTEPQLYVANLGYRKIKDHDAQITALRLQMEAL